MAEIDFERVTKVYADGTRAVSAVDLKVPDGDFCVLVGPSGCGKTTLLRMVAGLEQITEGTIRIGGRAVNDLPPKHRDIAMVFQNYALYPNMSVYDNMGFSLKLRRTPRRDVDRRVRRAGELLGLLDQLAKKPRTLSGGQRQRVAMGRALVRQPQAFLMDEPLSNLDAKLRVQMRAEIGRLQRDLAVTTIYVTHDQTEAMTLGDLVAVMRLGVIQQVAPPQVLFERPANLFVAGFIGSPAMNLIQATLVRGDGGLHAEFGGLRLRVPHEILAERPALDRFVGRPIVLGIRPEDVEDAAFVPDSSADARIRATVDLRETLGREAYLHFDLDEPPVLSDDVIEIAADTDTALLTELESQARTSQTRFVARVSARTQAKERQAVELAVDTTGLHFFDPETGNAVDSGASRLGREPAAVASA